MHNFILCIQVAFNKMFNRMFGVISLMFLCSYPIIQGSAGQINETVITVSRIGLDTMKCCAKGKCPCSDFALALEQACNNTEIKIASSIDLLHNVQFGSVSNITITGYNNPTVKCDNKGGLVGNYFGSIKIQNVTLDRCNEILIGNFTHVYMINCHFQNFNSINLTSDSSSSVCIHRATFTYGSVHIEAASVEIDNSNFHGSTSDGLVVFGNSHRYLIIPITISGCNFTNNYGYSVKCIGYASTSESMPQLKIMSSNFSSNRNSAVFLEFSNVTLSQDLIFYKNVAVDSDGAAISAHSSRITMNGGSFLFDSNVADNNGGAILLNRSSVFVKQGSILFSNNTANNGGAVYILGYMQLYHGSVFFCNNTAENGGAIYINGYGNVTYIDQTDLAFMGNDASSNGGAVFVDTLESSKNDQLILYYYDLLMKANCSNSNTASMVGNCAYFNVSSKVCTNNVTLKNKLFSSPLCRMNFSNIVVIVNSTYDYRNYLRQFEFSLHELHFDTVITDYFDNLLGPVNVSVNCVGTLENTSNYYIDSLHHNVTLTNDSIVRCNFMDVNSDSLYVTLRFFKNYEWITNVNVSIQWGQGANCNNDIAHIKLHQGVCVLLDCAIIAETHTDINIQIMGLHCNENFLSSSSGYWFSNGYQHYTTVCPSGYCDTSFNIMYYNGEPFHEPYPDSSVQCLTHWSGLACGECNSNNYSIQFDTSDCIPLDRCFAKSSRLPNLALLLSVSFLYWCLVISFVFVLLHFQFDVTAGYAYGVIFYYSVLEVIVKMLIKTQYIHQNFVNISLQTLPFLSNVGYLKPPFLKYLQLCLGGAETIDHVFINYIHPLIVTCLVAIIFITARRYVIVARLIGRYVNSKSICLLLLLSYSSVCYTSVQLLKPLAVFEGLSNNI